MSDDNENNDIEDVKVEEDALNETPLDAVKKQLMDKYGFNEAEHADLLAKMVEEKMEDRKKLSSAIKQKIKLRDKLKAFDQGSNKPVIKKDDSDIDIDALVERKLNERLDAKELESTDYSDALKRQIKDYSKLNGVSIREALKSEYILYQVKRESEKSEIDDASISAKHDKQKASKNFKNMSPKDFDVKTPEGREEWELYKKSLRD